MTFNWGKKFTELQEKQGKLGTQKALISRSFIAHAIDQATSKAREEQLEAIEREVEGLKKEKTHKIGFFGDGLDLMDVGYNQCITDALAIIKKYKGEE